jgi:hypothetical protein
MVIRIFQTQENWIALFPLITKKRSINYEKQRLVSESSGGYGIIVRSGVYTNGVRADA